MATNCKLCGDPLKVNKSVFVTDETATGEILENFEICQSCGKEILTRIALGKIKI